MKNYWKYSKILIERGALWAKLGTQDCNLFHFDHVFLHMTSAPCSHLDPINFCGIDISSLQSFGSHTSLSHMMHTSSAEMQCPAVSPPASCHKRLFALGGTALFQEAVVYMCLCAHVCVCVCVYFVSWSKMCLYCTQSPLGAGIYIPPFIQSIK